jgi:hypothetical protein
MLGLSKSFVIMMVIACAIWGLTKNFNNFLVIFFGYVIVKIGWNFLTK